MRKHRMLIGVTIVSVPFERSSIHQKFIKCPYYHSHMRILHLSDTHIGYSAYHKVAENGINQREMDVYNAFKQFVDYAVEHRPDAVIHSGDLFDSVRPSNRALSFALSQLLRLSEAEIPVVVIAGNHETPKLRETGSAFRIFEHLEHIYPVYRGKREEIEIENLLIHAIPHCHSAADLERNIRDARLRDGYVNVMALHAGVIGIKDFNYIRGDFNEQVIPSGSLSPHFDYIALGHYHKATQVTENAYYAGSTEHFSFKEAGEEKGFYEIDFSGSTNIQFIPLSCRGMLDLPQIDCMHLEPNEIETEILKACEKYPIEGKIVRISLQNIRRSAFKALAWHRIKRASSRALHFEIDYRFFETEHEMERSHRIGSLVDEWKEYIASVPIGKNKKEIEELALTYLSEVQT